ncbi:MAG: hypothetical protein O9352_14705 [Rhizobium sp.]|nr:hypothetical protein [Rhizobium sp.]
MSEKPFNILIADTYTTKNGEEKTSWIRLGVAFPNKNGEGFTCQLPEGVALTGKFMILPRTDKTEDAA